jgi:hypothetical protein
MAIGLRAGELRRGQYEGVYFKPKPRIAHGMLYQKAL